MIVFVPSDLTKAGLMAVRAEAQLVRVRKPLVISAAALAAGASVGIVSESVLMVTADEYRALEVEYGGEDWKTFEARLFGFHVKQTG